jgi:N-acyl-D-amino-acid deacylase
VLIPGWALDAEDGPTTSTDEGAPVFASRRQAFLRRLSDAELSQRIRDDIAHEIHRRGGADKLLILESHDPELVGLTVSEVAVSQGTDAIDIAITLQIEGLDRPGGARIRGFSLDERDVEHYMAQEFTATSTDAGIALAGEGYPHPRFFGTYPRKLRRYALDAGIISLAAAVRSSTSLPAQIAGLAGRGLIREGYAADVVVIDAREVADHATAMDPHRYSTGIDAVLINGQFAVRDGAPTGGLHGKVLQRDDFVRRRAAAPAGTVNGSPPASPSSTTVY